MNIAVIANPNYPVPPFMGYGGTQRGVYDLSIGLAKQGHSISVAASGDSSIVSHCSDITLVPIYPSGCGTASSSHEELMGIYGDVQDTIVGGIRQLADEQRLDVMNVRWERVALSRELAKIGVPMAVSIPSIMPMDRLERLHDAAMSSAAPVAFTAHTYAHRKALGDHPWIEVVPYGINMNSAPFSAEPLATSIDIPNLPLIQELKARGDDFLLHLGTISERKGQMTSLKIAQATGMPIIIAGTPNCYGAGEPDQYYEELRSQSNVNTYFFGNANEKEKYELMCYAKATLFCSGYEDASFAEPFGRVLAESAATGTPVVGYRYGSFPELIDEGVTGYGFSTIDEAVQKVKNLDDHDRVQCAAKARDKLSETRFVQGIQALLQRLVREHRAL